MSYELIAKEKILRFLDKKVDCEKCKFIFSQSTFYLLMAQVKSQPITHVREGYIVWLCNSRP